MPSPEDRLEILKALVSHRSSDVQIDDLRKVVILKFTNLISLGNKVSDAAHAYLGADIASLVSEAVMVSRL